MLFHTQLINVSSSSDIVTFAHPGFDHIPALTQRETAHLRNPDTSDTQLEHFISGHKNHAVLNDQLVGVFPLPKDRRIVTTEHLLPPSGCSGELLNHEHLGTCWSSFKHI